MTKKTFIVDLPLLFLSPHFFEELKKVSYSLVSVVESKGLHKKRGVRAFTIFLSTSVGPKKFYFESNELGKIDFSSVKVLSGKKFLRPSAETLKDFYFGMRSLMRTWKH